MMERSKPCGEKCLGRRNGECKGPEVDTDLVYLRKSKEASVDGTEWAVGEWRTGSLERLAGKSIYEVSSVGQGLWLHPSKMRNPGGFEQKSSSVSGLSCMKMSHH